MPMFRRISAPMRLGTTKTYQTGYLLDQQVIAPGATGFCQRPPVRRRQGGRGRRHQFPARRSRWLQQAARPQQIRSADRLGMVLFHHQAAVPGHGPDLPLDRQFRRRDPDGHGAAQGPVLPARQQVLCIDGEDEGGAAADAGAARALSGRQGQAATGADGALQAREDQSGGRLPADRDPDPGVLRALQGAVRHHRNAPGAVLRLDQGSLRARSHQSCSTCSGCCRSIRRSCRW